MDRSWRSRGAILVLVGAISVPPAAAQTRGAEVVREQKPAYPEQLHQGLAQGTVIVIGRIDRNGRLQDPRAVFTTHEPLVSPTLAALRGWAFKPAVRDGQPIDIAANIVFPFRVRDEKGKLVGKDLARPLFRELAVFPADASGARRAPEGFPIHRGADPRVRVEAALDVPARPAARRIPFRADAVSPAGRRVAVFEDSVPVPAGRTEARLSFSAKIGPDWEDGIWMLRFSADGSEAAKAQFWLAADPARFDFAAALKKK